LRGCFVNLEGYAQKSRKRDKKKKNNNKKKSSVPN
jgi:hypothetical protein